MSMKLSPAEWRLWLLWVAATSLGMAVGFLWLMVAAPFGPQFVYLWYYAGQSPIIQTIYGLLGVPVLGVLVLGIALGTPQWLVLRRHLPRMAWWVPATSVGVALGLVVAVWWRFTLSYDYPTDLGFRVAVAMMGASLGLFIGLAQALVLKRHLPRAGWWVLTSVTAWAALATASLVWVGFLETTGPLAEPLFYPVWGVIVLVPGAITGAALVWLLRHPRPRKEAT